MIDSINSQMGQAAISALTTSTSEDSSSDTDTIISQIMSSGRSYSAQQIADKYGISVTDAQQVLSQIEKATAKKEASAQNTKNDIPDYPQLEESEEPATITYRV